MKESIFLSAFKVLGTFLKNLQNALDHEKQRADEMQEQMRMQEIRNIEGQAQLVQGDQRAFDREMNKLRNQLTEKGNHYNSLSKFWGMALIKTFKMDN